MKLSEVFRKAAEKCHKTAWGWPAATNGQLGADTFFRNLFLEEGGVFVEFGDDKNHRVLALCMAASIAESEGL